MAKAPVCVNRDGIVGWCNVETSDKGFLGTIFFEREADLHKDLVPAMKHTLSAVFESEDKAIRAAIGQADALIAAGKTGL